MPNGPPVLPFLERIDPQHDECVDVLNALIAQRDAEGFRLLRIIPCPGKNWVGARNYHLLIVWEPKLPSP